MISDQWRNIIERISCNCLVSKRPIKARKGQIERGEMEALEGIGENVGLL